jgi:quinol monooxygenase YgiN
MFERVNTKFFFLSVAMLACALCRVAVSQDMQTPGQYCQIAEIEINPAQLEDYKAAVKEHIETAVRVEPGVLMLYVLSEKDNPTHIRVFEIYASEEAYKAHLNAPHFKKYKAVTQNMVKSLKLVRADPVALEAKGK